MKLYSTFTSLFFLTCFLSISNINSQCNSADFQALRDIYLNMDGDNWVDNTGWDLVKNNTTPPGSCDLGSMFGVTVNGTTNRVTRLELGNNSLNGSIPTSIGDMEFLQVLAIGDSVSTGSSVITGQIPDEICNLPNLSAITIQFHELTGSIPDSIGKLANLTYLNLYSNPNNAAKLTGAIPSSLGQCTGLYSLLLSFNDFSGNLPATLVNCSILQNIYIENALQTSQTLPGFLNNIPSLRRIRLSNNNFTGALPNLSNLNLLEFHILNNDFNGPLPSYIGNWTNVRQLLLGNNSFTGPLPSQWSSLSNLDYLILDNNPINSNIPSSWSGMTYMRLFRASNCGLTGSIPPIFASMPRLGSLRLIDNNLSGTIPDVFQGKPILRDVRLHGNMLTGSIPASFGEMPAGSSSNKTVLYLYDNDLTGCYDANLLNLCSPDTAYAISVNIGNSMDALWQDFCASNAGICATGSSDYCDISNGKPINLSVDGNACIDGVLNASEGIQLTPRATAPTDPALGQLYFDGNTNTLRYWNGLTWVIL